MKSSETKSKKSLQPKLRFPEFEGDGDWKIKKIGDKDFASLHKGKGISKSDIDLNGKTPCIRYGELYTKYNEVIDEVFSKTNSPTSDLFLSHKNDVILPASGETKIDIAKASCVTLENVALGGDLNVIRSKDNGIFISYYLNGPKKREVAKVAQGDSVVHLYLSQLEKLELLIPKEQEQQKIADCLSSLDELIEAEDQKLEALQRHKKGLTQEIFPSEGQTLPRLRFPEFQSAPEWEETLLGNHCTITTGKLDANAMVENGQYRFYTCAKDYYLIDKYAFDTDALLVSGNGANVGYIHYYKGKFNAYQRTYVLDQLTQDIFFIKYYLEKNLHKRIATEKKEGNTPYIVMSTLTDMIIILPKNKKEQQKIADCLSSIDDSITSQSKKLKSLRLHKKGLMQQLFPNVGEAETPNNNANNQNQ